MPAADSSQRATNLPMRPASAVPAVVGWAGVAGFVLALWLTREVGWTSPVGLSAILLGTALPMVLLEWRRFGRKRSHAASTDEALAVGRSSFVARRTLGMLLTVSPFVVFQASVLLYYPRQRVALAVALGYAAVALVTTIIASAAAPGSEQRGDTLHALGSWLLRERALPHDEAIGNHFRVWALKLFFVPFLAAALPGNAADFERAWSRFLANPDFTGFVLSAHGLFFLLDISVGLIGYVLTVRWLGAEVRSTNSARSAWFFCLICYPPFYPAVYYWLLNYRTGGVEWHSLLAGHPALLYLWGTSLLILEFVYVWASFAFGPRFSNLTDRGILTSGPYWLVKHPAYLAKNLSWWLWYLPFVPAAGAGEAVLDCLQLGMLSAIYWMRAKTEEEHLRANPAYCRYEAWMARRWAWLPWRRPGRTR